MSAADAMVLVVASKGFKDLRAALRTNPMSLLQEAKQRRQQDEDLEARVDPDSEMSGELATADATTLRRAERLYKALSQSEQDKLGVMVRRLGGGRSDLWAMLG